MKKVEDLRKFVITHQDDFHIILAPENTDLRDKAEKELLQIYSTLYDSIIRDLYETDISSAADVLRVGFGKNFKRTAFPANNYIANLDIDFVTYK